MHNVSEYLTTRSARVETALRECVAGCAGAPESLRDAMAYSLMAGGKRLRPALALGAAEIAGAGADVAMPAACALEMVHTYSLIHDDLPSMDNDVLRRGKPTAHVQFGEALAILSGDALLTLAFEVIARTGRADAVAELARAAGAEGMAGGQVIDLASENRQLTLDELRHLHACKTGALIRVAVRLGAMLADADAATLDALTRYGEHIGLAFQIADDILDVTGTEEAMGKRVRRDAENHKSTYPALVGLDRARELAGEAVRDAIAALEPFGPEADAFRALAPYIVERSN
jgi:geranylgeranyl diphosphate synthase type II